MSRAGGSRRGPGRPSGATSGASRDAILRAAKEIFAKQGFSQATTRAIARRARVDVALVHYFFQTKAKLFTAAVELPVESAHLQEILGGGEGRVGERVVRFYLDHVFAGGNPAVVALLRAAVGDPGCVPALRSMIETRIVDSAASAISGRNARVRAELLGSLLVGLFLVRHIVGVEPLASCSTADVAKLMGPAVEALLRP